MHKREKTIYLLRHGKASWDFPEEDDIKRTLEPIGEQRTHRIAKYLKEINVKIDKIFTSPAQRAYDTSLIIQKSLNLTEPEIHQSLYPGSVDDILSCISSTDDNIDSILIVGHNPGLTYFAHEMMNADIDNIPTSGIISCNFKTQSWQEFPISEKKLNFFVVPKKLT